MALVSVGAPVSSRAWVTTVKVRLPRTGKLNQSVWPTWLSRPLHSPLAGIVRGAASVPMASLIAAHGRVGDSDGERLRAAGREIAER